MVKKICIIGMAKSGTSALYSSIKIALPAPRRLLFEPNNAAELAYVTASATDNALTKLMFSSHVKNGYDPNRFTHRVAIVRDPRDTVVSSILYQFNRYALLKNGTLFLQLVKLFEDKEADPKSISVHDILEAIEVGKATEWKKNFTRLLQKYSTYLRQGSHHVMSFDQMVSGDFVALNEYLGLTLAPPPPLDGWVSKIGRKGESGDWKNWFTPQDVTFFREAMDPFLAEFGFDPAWDLNDEPVILPEHCSKYIRRLSQARQADPNLKHDTGSDIASLLSAAEDGKMNALVKLVHLFEGRGKQCDPAKAAQFRQQLFDMGYDRQSIERQLRLPARIALGLRKLF